MRALPAVAAFGLVAATLSARVYVDREHPVEPAAAVRTAPAATVVTPDPAVPAYRPPAAVIVR